MSEHDTGGPAFPAFQPLERFDDELGRYTETMQPVGGMTLRDYFAAQVCSGLVAFKVGEKLAQLFETPESRQNPMPDDYKQTAEDYFAEISYRLADALMKARAQ